MSYFTRIICLVFMGLHNEIGVTSWQSINLKYDIRNPCEYNSIFYDTNHKLCYMILESLQMPNWTENQCSSMNTNDFPIQDAKIFDQKSFYGIFGSLKKEKPAFSKGSMEVLISLTYRRGDGFRWIDNSIPNDLSFLKFNPIDNLDDDDNLTENYCLRFSIIVDENAQDGYGTKWYECQKRQSIEYIKKSFYLLCSYSKIEIGEVQQMNQKSSRKKCRRNEIPVKINNIYLCYVHLVNTEPMTTDMITADSDICRNYSEQYGQDTEHWNQLSPASVPTRNLLQLLQKEILSVHRQFQKRTHGLLIGLTYMHKNYQWNDNISFIHPSLKSLLTEMIADEECYRFMLFQSVSDHMVPVSCSDTTITFDILCKYLLDKEPSISKIQLMKEIKAIIDEKAVVENKAKRDRTNLSIALLITIIINSVVYNLENKNEHLLDKF